MGVSELPRITSSIAAKSAPCLVGSPSGPALEGFIGGMMGTTEALKVPSGSPMGIGTPCDIGSGSHYIRGGTDTKIESIPSSSTVDIWGLMGTCPCPGVRRLGDPDLSTIDSTGWSLCWRMPSSIGVCVPMTTVVELLLASESCGHRLASCRRSVCGALGQ